MNDTKKHKRKLSYLYWIIMIVFLGIAVYAGYNIISLVVEGNEEESQFEDLYKIIEEYDDGSEDNTIDPDTGEKVNPFEKLHLMNSDFAAWLTIDETNINYPVMYTPDEPEYYLRRSFNKESARSGTPFVGEGYTIDSSYCIIYGHNMNNGNMFADLTKYKDKDYWEEHQILTLTTYLGEVRTYQIVSAVETRILYASESGFRYYSMDAEPTTEDLQEFEDWLTANECYDTDLTFSEGSQILVLSTCSYHTDNGRFIIVAERID